MDAFVLKLTFSLAPFCTFFHILVPYISVWTMYEIFLHETDSYIIDISGQGDLRKKCQEMMQETLRKMLETVDRNSKDYITIGYLNYRINMLNNETNDNFQFIQVSDVSGT